MNSLPGRDDYTSEKLTIRIEQNSIPTFTYVDLPGIRTFPPRAAQETKSLAHDYLRDENTLVICVVAAPTPRITSDPAVALLHEFPGKDRAILVIPKA